MTPLEELATMGDALGGLRWVQGPGGNVSVKTDGELWVKASGKLLREVAEEGGHSRVSLDVVRRALDGDASADHELFARTPRPSLEAYFHALGGRVVCHTHPLGGLLYACSDGPVERTVSPGVRSIPYVRPGRGVALAVRDVLDVLDGEWEERVVVLRSHGVVVFAPTAARAIALTMDFDESVRASFGALPEYSAAPYLEPVEIAFEGGFARSVPERAMSSRYLFPDAPVCASAVEVASVAEAARVAAQALAAVGRACILVDPSGARLAIAKSAVQLRQTCEVLSAHEWIEDVLVARGRARYLDDDEPAAILQMPSEQYRIRLAELR